ncbi:MAG: endoribonuclease YbeY [Hyphobacterium sp.]|nr:MAG: endoribonuclease YbeY [Hyphobacterium sp.]
MTLSFDLIAEADGWPEADQLSDVIAKTLDALACEQKLSEGRRICFLFTDDIAMAELNGLHRGRSRPTNVLSFPAHESAEDELGDIAFGRETVFREAHEKSISVIDHVAHLVVHGVLHLLGYDHETQLEAETMEAIERGTLSRIGIADPYLGER